jgi:hypothetical protein
MTDDIFDFAIGARCRLAWLGIERNPRAKMTTGTIVGKGRSANSVRVLFDGYTTPVSLHRKYIELISDAIDGGPPALKRPRDVADRSLDLREIRKLKDEGGFRQTFTLPLHAARLKARQILDEYAQGDYATIVERWCQLPDGQIEFTMRRLPIPKS